MMEYSDLVLSFTVLVPSISIYAFTSRSIQMFPNELLNTDIMPLTNPLVVFILYQIKIMKTICFST
ncbi:Uncharacterized protein APZ42_006605, partial [Daphnia magna]